MIIALASKSLNENDAAVHKCANALAASQKKLVQFVDSIPGLGDDKVLTLVGHGLGNTITVDSAQLSPAEFARKLISLGLPKSGIEFQFVACNIGKLSVEAESYVQQVAKLLGTEVSVTAVRTIPSAITSGTNATASGIDWKIFKP